MEVFVRLVHALTDGCRGLLRWTLRLTLVAALAVGAVVWASAQGPVTVPDWAAARLETRLSRALADAGLTARVQGVQVALRGGVPVVIVEGLRLSRPGEEVLQLDRLEALASAEAALHGRLAPRALRLRGLDIRLSRDNEGRMNLRVDKAALDAAPSPAALLARLHALSRRPPFDSLQVVGLAELDLRIADAVRDHGIGMNVSKVREAINAFGQVDREKLEQQGGGLGLALVSRHAEIQGGRLEIAARESGGSIVRIVFPLL